MSSLGIFDKETKTYKKVADLSKTAVIDSAMSSTSNNAVQNKVVKSYVDDHTVVDSAMSDTSTNAVQNKVVKSYVDNGVNSSKKLQTYKPGSTTETYGDAHPIYAQCRDSSHVKMKCDNYTVETDYATSAGSANYLKSTAITGDFSHDTTPGYRLLYSVNITRPWTYYRGIYSVRSRHQGTGILSISISCEKYIVSQENVDAEIKYFGTGDVNPDSYQIYVSSDGANAYLFAHYYDYSNLSITLLADESIDNIDRYGGLIEINNGEWMTEIDTSKYGALKAQTQINNSATVNGHTVNSDVPSGAKFTDTTYYVGANPPENTSALWIDSLHGGMLNYFASETSKWHPVRAKGYDTPVDLINEGYWKIAWLGPGITVGHISAIYDINTDKVTITIYDLKIASDATMGPNQMVCISMPMYNLGNEGIIHTQVSVGGPHSPDLEIELHPSEAYIQFLGGQPYAIYAPVSFNPIKFETKLH